jgi:hypothetical protein
MGVTDIKERFSGLQVEADSVAAVIRDACQEAAEKINAVVAGEPTELQAVLQFLEQAAHAGFRGFRGVEPVKAEEAPADPPGANTEGGEDPESKRSSRAKPKPAKS